MRSWNPIISFRLCDRIIFLVFQDFNLHLQSNGTLLLLLNVFFVCNYIATWVAVRWKDRIALGRWTDSSIPMKRDRLWPARFQTVFFFGHLSLYDFVCCVSLMRLGIKCLALKTVWCDKNVPCIIWLVKQNCSHSQKGGAKGEVSANNPFPISAFSWPHTTFDPSVSFSLLSLRE